VKLVADPGTSIATVTLHAATIADLSPTTLYAVLRLRLQVFVVEQRCPYQDLDGRDTEPDTRHVWYGDGEVPLAYLRILAEPDGTARIGRVCVDPAARGTGLARRLMLGALDLIGPRPVILDAQSYLAGFYAGLGFASTGPEFVEDGIPHVPMRREA
jgi:ElaA protein